MTGKDFSGPTPVIRAPTPLGLPDDNQRPSQAVVPGEGQTRAVKVRKKSRTPALDGVEIIGLVEDQVEHPDD